MTRNLKALGLALIAIFAMSAFVASAAQAEGEGTFNWEAGTTWLTGSANEDQTFTILSGLTVKCDEVVAQVMVNNEGGSATTLTTEGLTYNDKAKGEDKCRGPLGTSPKIETNGCQYVFHAGTTLNEMETEGDATVQCPEGAKGIVINAPGCVVTVPGGQTVGPVFYRTETGSPNKVIIEPEVVDITYSTSGILCGTHNNEHNGTYTGDVTVRGETAEGAPTNIEVT